MSAERTVAAATLIAMALLVSPAAFAASRPGYQNVPNAQGEGGFPGPAGVQGLLDRDGGGGASAGGGGGGSGSGGGGDRGRASGGGPGVSGGAAGGLPFTGVNLIVLSAFGCILVGCGLLLMHAARER